MVNPRASSPDPRNRFLPARRLCRGFRWIALSLLLISLAVSPGLAQDKKPEDVGMRISGGAETFFYSRYVSRGIASSEGPVFQPSAWLTMDAFTFNVFGNYVLAGEKQQGRFNEADISLAWSREWNRIVVEPKFTLSTYPNTEDQTQYEAGLTLARDFGHWKLSTYNSVTFAVSEKASYYGEVALEYERDLSEEVTFTTEFAFSWPTPTASLEGKLSYHLTKAWSLHLHAGYSITTQDAALADNHFSSEQDTIPQGRNGFFGVGLGFEF
jgi:hypothetical protein